MPIAQIIACEATDTVRNSAKEVNDTVYSIRTKTDLTDDNIY